MDATSDSNDREQSKRLIETRLNYLMAVAWQVKGTQLQSKVGVSDLVMATLTTALDKVEKGEVNFTDRSDKEVNGWLVNVLKYTWQDLKKYHNADSRTPGDLPVRLPMSPSGEAVLKEELQRIDEAKAALSPEDQQILTWKDDEDLTFEEIGERLGYSGSYANKKYHAVRAALAKSLRGNAPPSE